MREHKGKRLCITGIPTSGKTTLTRRLAEETNAIVVSFDEYREELALDDRYAKWVNFYLDQDLETYYTTTTPEQEWNNLVSQCEALWPAFLERIYAYADEERPVVFEGVNLLPHLMKKDLGFPCVVLIGSSYEETLARNTEDPRWGESEREIELNSKSFFFVERPNYLNEAKKAGYPIFEASEKAYSIALSYLK